MQHIEMATHNYDHTLNLVITQPACCPTHINVDFPIISDHDLVTCCLPLARPSPVVQHNKTIRRLHAIDNGTFITAVQQSSICSNIDALAGCSTGELCALYMSELRRILDQLAPPVNVLASDGAAPWLDGDCRACRRRARVLERRFRRSRLAADRQAWAAAMEEKRALFIVKKHTYWKRKLETCSGNSKQLYGAVSILCCYVTMHQSTQQSPQHSLFHHSSLTRLPEYVKPLTPIHRQSALNRVSISSTTSSCAQLTTFAVSSYSRQASHVTLIRYLTHFS